MEQHAGDPREQYIALMGDELGKTFAVLSNDLLMAFAYWRAYEDLYSSPEQIEVLNDVAGSLFWIVQQSLLHGVLLQLARLTDSRSTLGKDNLTVLSLPGLIAEPVLRREVERLVADAREACKDAKAWRHKLLAHRDRDVALSLTGAGLPEVPLASIDAALQSIAAVLNRLEAHFNRGGTVAYDFIEIGGGARSLVYYLRKGLEAERAGIA